MTVTYSTAVIGEGNHTSLHIPDAVLAELGTNRRAPLKVTINGHTYQSTATGVGSWVATVGVNAKTPDYAGVSVWSG